MTLDYEALLLESIQEGFIGYEIVNHFKLSYLSIEQTELCRKALFNTMKDQDLIDENVGFEDRYRLADKVILSLKSNTSTKWRILLNTSYRGKVTKGNSVIYFPDSWKKLPRGTHFISGYTYKSQNYEIKFEKINKAF